ncbi:TIM barrel protein [Ascidiaceihabitans sp.]|uniref:hydroxypyruvate isomerase family protein n=1 Tax=Ascidiaceihabitans sp. TaxID=1872644 RepID=UPI0032989D26
MTKFSANLGFLWQDRPLPDAIRAAKAAGFDAVECHWPYAVPAEDTLAALSETGLTMLGLNTSRGNTENGENGLSALPGRQADARAAIETAISYARTIGAKAVHIMAGFASGPEAHRTFVENLVFAASAAPDLTLLIEPLNPHDAPGYFLQTTSQAIEIIEDCKYPNIKLMFDCYHVARTEGDVTTRLQNLHSNIGHIQFAGVPSRGRPDEGEINYLAIFDAISKLGWSAPLGAEYKPANDTDASLGWMQTLV